jgi:hypothetical protein
MMSGAGNETAMNSTNHTLDVACKNCFTDFDMLACARSGLMSILAFLTGVACVLRICRLHWVKHPQVNAGSQFGISLSPTFVFKFEQDLSPGYLLVLYRFIST